MSEKNIIYIGLDDDDTAFHGTGINRVTGEITAHCALGTEYKITTYWSS